MGKDNLTGAAKLSIKAKQKNKPGRYYDKRTSISVNSELWEKFMAHAGTLNMTASQMINLVMLGIVATEKLEPVLDKIFDRVIEEKEKDRQKSK